MFGFKSYPNVPVLGGRRFGGGVVEIDGRVALGRGGVSEGVYTLDEMDSNWNKVANFEMGAALGVCEGRLLSFGGNKDDMYTKKVLVLDRGRWSLLTDMLVECARSCILNVSEGVIVVMGGMGDGKRFLNDVQVFNGKTQTWHRGPSLPKPCAAMSAVVYGNLVFIMGGDNMAKAVWCTNIHDLKSIWTKFPDAPCEYSSVTVVDGVLLAIGGTDNQEGSKKTSAIYAFHHRYHNWKHVGNMPFECSWADTLLLSKGGVLVVDMCGTTHQALKITTEGLAQIFSIIPNPNKADERKRYEEIVTKGYLKISVTKCLIIGAAGVGKTNLKHVLMKKDPPEQTVSTGLADNPVQTVSFSLAGVGGQEEDDWFVVEDDQALMKVMNRVISGCNVSITTSLEEVVSTLPKMVINVTSDTAGTVHSNSIPASAMDTTQHSKMIAIEEELIHHINHSTDTEKLLSLKRIQLVDSGGQLQYLDILPLFIQNPGVTIFVLNLSEEWSHQPTIEYYGADGKPVSRPYQSPLSHEQILQHCLGTMLSWDAQPRITIVGTHRDAAGWCSESIKEKNQKLKALLDAGSFRVLYNQKELKEAIFAVNSNAPLDEDRHVAMRLRHEILSISPDPINIPTAWFILEVFIQVSSHNGILSLTDCKECAKRLHIEGDAFSSALQYLVDHNIFLHYPEVLPQIVFCDPQVVLSKVTELVEYHHRLRNNPIEKSMAEANCYLNKFMNHGLLSVELLKKFPKYYRDGLFTPQDLLQLMLSIGAIAVIKDSVYLMPALLNYLESMHVSKYFLTDSLVIKPTQGCIASGLFCCLVAHLLSYNGVSPWKVCMKADIPSCLYRNCISFEIQCTREIVTLVDFFSYIVVHVNTMSSGIRSEVRERIQRCIKNACRVLKYHGVPFKDAFRCSGRNCTSDPPHVAVVSGKTWKCCIQEQQIGDLSKSQLMWLSRSGITRQDSSTLVPVSLDSEAPLSQLMDKVAAVIPHKYEMVGLQLGLTQDELRLIGPHNPTLEENQRVFGEILSLWKRLGSPPYTWRTLIGVLKSASVGEAILSEQLTSWITSTSEITGGEVTVQSISSKSIKVSWTLPQDTSKHGAIQGYELSYSTLEDSTSVLNVGVTNYAEITGLKPYTTYSISVRTRAAGIYSEYSNPCTVTTNEDVPSAPVAIDAYNITATSMTVSWQPPENANGIIKCYQVSYTPHGESECIHDVDSDITSAELNSLEPCTEYTIRVRAKTVEFGDSSKPITATTSVDELLLEKVSTLLDNYQEIKFKELRIVKLIFYGAPRAGKTTLRKQLLEQPCGNIEPSTPIAEVCDPILVQRVVAMTDEKNEWKWNVQELHDLAKSLLTSLEYNKRLHCVNESRESHEASITESAIDSASLKYFSVQQKSNEEQIEIAGSHDLSVDKVQSQVSEESTSNSTHATRPNETNLQGKNTQRINIKDMFQNAVITGRWKEVMAELKIDKAVLLQIIDGGGQPSFQEIFPLLISGPSVTLLVFKLTDDLEEPCKVLHQPIGGSGGQKIWNDTYIVKDIISNALSSFTLNNAKNTTQIGAFSPFVMLVGTHKDELEVSGDSPDQKERNKEDKIIKIAQKLDGYWQKSQMYQSIHVPSIESLITGFSKYDKKDMISVKKKIEHMLNELKSEDIPAPWLVFDFVLHEYAKTNNWLKVETSVCKDIASICGVKDDEVKAVLSYLHSVAGTLLYYSEIDGLNKYVITDFQLIFNSISQVIIQFFDDDKNGPHLDKKRAFKQKGQLCKKDLKEFKGCLNADEVISLLEGCHIICKIVTNTLEDVFFMPSVLPKKDLLHTHTNNSNHTNSPSFLVLFTHHGCCPVGVFCATTTTLIVEHKWEINEGANQQFRNKIDLYCKNSGKSYNVIFSAFSAHYEVCLMEEAMPDVKYVIYQNIAEVFGKVCKDMNYPLPLYGFYCPKSCKSGDVSYPQYQHPALCEFSSESQEMKCCYSNKRSSLTKEHQQWFTPPQEQKTSQDQTKGSLECSEEDIYIITGYDFDWRRVGRRLIGNQKIQDIEREGGCEDGKKENMLLQWKQIKSRDATYHALVKVLRMIQNNAIADRVEELERKKKNTEG